MADESEAPRWRIGQLSRRLEISPELLRAWEQRYALLRPGRSSGGFRLYSSADEERVRRMLAYKERGVATAEAARFALAEEESRDGAADEAAQISTDKRWATESLRTRLTSALVAFDETDAQATIDRAFASVGVDQAVLEVVLPALRDIGKDWEQARVDIAQEHYATNVLQARLIGLARGWYEGQGPRAVLACAPGELHVVGLICLGLALRQRGWRVLFLGADTPIAALERTTRDVAPSLVALSAVLPERFLVHEKDLTALSGRVKLGLGGAGAMPHVAERLGALPSQPDPVSAAEEWGRSAHPGT